MTSRRQKINFGFFGPVVSIDSSPLSPSLSIAVLPFTVLGGTVEEGYLADGITDDLITRLSQISGTTVIGRSTMFTFRDRKVDARAVGHDLNVRYIVVGTIRGIRDHIQINVALVDSESGGQLWADKIEHPALDWQLVTSIVSLRIARTLNLELMSVGSGRSDSSAPSVPHAVELAMRGWVELFNKPQTRESNEAAQTCLSEALALDRRLSLAWTGLAYATYRAASFGWADYSFEDGMRQAIKQAEQAIELDPRAADAYYAMGQSLNAIDELERAQISHEMCISLNPSHAPAYGALGQVRMFLGYPQETGGLCAHALALSPREPLCAIWYRSRGLAALFLGNAAEAAADARAALVINPKYPTGCVLLAAAEAKQGRIAEAKEAISQLRKISPNWTLSEIRRFQARPRRERFSMLLEDMLSNLRRAGLPD